jgi:exodeoxyribonuclease-5
MAAREGTGVAIITRSQLALKTELAAEQILCGKNDTRVTLNRRIRGQLQELGKLPHGRSISDPLPVVGDRIICLKNKRDRGFLNGGMWTVKEIRDRDIIAKKKGRDDVSYLAVDSIDGMGTNYAMVPNPFWFWNGKANDLHLPEKMQRSHYHEFDYGYAITCHKSQGSQWDKVLVYDESQIFGRAGEEDIPDRWLYTAATRAAEALIIVVGD